MTAARDTIQLCFSSILVGIVDNKIEQSFYCLFLFRNRVNRTRSKLLKAGPWDQIVVSKNEFTKEVDFRSDLY